MSGKPRAERKRNKTPAPPRKQTRQVQKHKNPAPGSQPDSQPHQSFLSPSLSSPNTFSSCSQSALGPLSYGSNTTDKPASTRKRHEHGHKAGAKRSSHGDTTGPRLICPALVRGQRLVSEHSRDWVHAGRELVFGTKPVFHVGCLAGRWTCIECDSQHCRNLQDTLCLVRRMPSCRVAVLE